MLAVALGGAIGGLARYGFIAAFPVTRMHFPWVIFLENVCGAFLLGLVLAILLTRRWGWELRPLLTTGVLGSFTTFSTYTLGIVQLMGEAQVTLGIVYGIGSVVAGLGAAWIGIALGRAVSGGGA